ncbi:hypothetical protein K2X89_16905 [Myxococcota bacterium]|nr:hypothetical protein [Myxococcota bacterium]
MWSSLVRREPMRRSASRRGGLLRALAGIAALVAAVLFGATSARAHGPTVEIRATGLSPALLNLYQGTTVHFANTIAAPEGLVVLVDEAGQVRSPVLAAPGDGWHYTFEATGRYAIRLAGRPEAKMTIVVVPKRPD